jgi:hypothetical protein
MKSVGIMTFNSQSLLPEKQGVSLTDCLHLQSQKNVMDGMDIAAYIKHVKKITI